MWKGSVRACLEHLTEKHGGSTFFAMKNVAKFFPPWTVTRNVWLDALRPDVSGVAVDALLFHEAGTPSGPSLSDLQGPVSAPGAPGRCCSPPVILCVPDHGPAHSSENIDPVIGGASGSGACGVFSGGSPPLYGQRAVAMCRSLTKSPCWGTRSCQCAHRSRRH